MPRPPRPPGTAACRRAGRAARRGRGALRPARRACAARTAPARRGRTPSRPRPRRTAACRAAGRRARPGAGETRGGAEAIGAAGKGVGQMLRRARVHAAPGGTLKELDEAAREVLKKAGATSPFLNYKPRFAPIPFPAVICTSVNDAALHGIPDGYKLKAGDLLSVDAGATLDGGVADAAISVTLGAGWAEDARPIASCEDALRAV